jgi:hypothetical protein
MGGPPSLHHGVGRREGEPTTSAEATPLPVAALGVDARLYDAWCTFLGKLATDAEAALAAALAYRQLDDSARDEWLSALRQDETRIRAPRLAVYAPLLAVESDERRRDTILRAMGSDDVSAAAPPPATAMRGKTADGAHVVTIVRPLYLSFVGVLACGYRRSGGFLWVKHDPIVDGAHAPRPGAKLGGCVL